MIVMIWNDGFNTSHRPSVGFFCLVQWCFLISNPIDIVENGRAAIKTESNAMPFFCNVNFWHLCDSHILVINRRFCLAIRIGYDQVF